MTRPHRTRRLSLLLIAALGGAFAFHCGSPPSPSTAAENYSAPEIIRSTLHTYQSATRYEDRGVLRSPGSLLDKFFSRFFNRGRATTFATRYDRGSGSFEIVTGGRTWRAEAVDGKGRLSKSRSAAVTQVDSMADALSSLAGISSGASVSVPSLLWRRDEDPSWLGKLQGVERLPDVRSRGRNLLAIKGSSPAIDYEIWIDSADFTIRRIVRRVHARGMRYEHVIEYTHVRIGGVTEPGP